MRDDTLRDLEVEPEGGLTEQGWADFDRAVAEFDPSRGYDDDMAEPDYDWDRDEGQS